MTTKKPLPTADDIIAFLTSRSGKANKAEIAKKFGITGDDRIGLKHLLKEMLLRGKLHQGTFRTLVLPAETDNGASALRAKRPLRDDQKKDERSNRFLGLYRGLRIGGGMIEPIARGDKHPVTLADGKTLDARDGDLVQAMYGPRGWEMTEILAREGDAGMISLMAIKNLDIPNEFSKDVLDETQGITVPELGTRTDLRNVPLVTIDGDDSRDFDDAVYAAPDDNPHNEGGWIIIVAIADVAHYVRSGSALDDEAYKRGNSVYFPDRVVPMLPEALSNDLCSLRPHEDRACMAAKMRIDKDGNLIDTKILRGLMKSVARLTYNTVQAALDGHPDDTTKPLLDTVIKPLYGAYKTLEKARYARGAVELDLPERKVSLKDGVVQDIVSRARYDSHKLIEELMILANVAVATALEERDQELLYRIHAKPDNARWATTRDFLVELGLRPKYSLSPSPQDLKTLLESVEGRDEAPLVNDIILRTMSQASYSPENVGHFGLALEKYAHFTSPIRRYADLIVHRALIRAFKLGNDGLRDAEIERLPQMGAHISDRERVAQGAERETIDRYIAIFMKDKVGATFSARVSGVTNFGLFVNVAPVGADGLIPVRTLPEDFYIFDEKRHSLTGRRNGLKFTLAMPLTVRLVEVDPAMGRLLMALVPGQFAEGAGGERSAQRRGERRDENDRRHRRPERDFRPRGGDGSGNSRGGERGGNRGKRR